VSHLASVRDPERDLTLNATAHLRFLEILRQANDTARIVFSSTRQVYGRAVGLPVTEETLPRPIDVNGAAKLAAEHLHLLYGSRRAGGTAVLRLSNVYGPRQHLGRADLGVLPVFIRRALRGEPLVVFGEGRDTRDPVHVDDVVDAIIAAALSEEASGRVVNIGHEQLFTVTELAELIALTCPTTSSVCHEQWSDEHAIVDVGPVQLSLTRAADLLGWKPQIAFEDGVRDTFAWFAMRPERYR
jgi:UDP-glucose 4-epimerase